MFQHNLSVAILLGLLAYRGIDSYCTKRNLTLTAAILWNLRRLLVWTAVFGVVVGIGFLLYYIFTGHIPISQYQFFVGSTILLVLSFLFALRSDIRAGRKYKAVAAKTACDKCGKMDLRFTGFKDGYKSGVPAHANPKAKCSGCGHEQMLVPLA